nr:hypothetical protein CFP56_04088 [Quercus suber]
MPESQRAQISKVVLNVSQGEHSPVTHSPAQVGLDAAAATVHAEEDTARSAGIMKETLPLSDLSDARSLSQSPAVTDLHEAEQLECVASPPVKPLDEKSSIPIPIEARSVLRPAKMNVAASARQKDIGVLDDPLKPRGKWRAAMQGRGTTVASKFDEREARKAIDALTQSRSAVHQPRQHHKSAAASIRSRKPGASSIARPSALQALRDKKQGVATDAGPALQRDGGNVSMMPASRDVSTDARKPVPPAPMFENENNGTLSGSNGLTTSLTNAKAASLVKKMPGGKVDFNENSTNGGHERQSNATKAGSKATNYDTPINGTTKTITGSHKRPGLSSKKLDADDETSMFDLPLTPGSKKQLKLVGKKLFASAKTKKPASAREAESDTIVPGKTHAKRKPNAAQVQSQPQRSKGVSSRSQGATLTRSKAKAKASTRVCVDERNGPPASGLPPVASSEPPARVLIHGSDPPRELFVHESLSQFENQVVDLGGEVLNDGHMSARRQEEGIPEGSNARGSGLPDMPNHASDRELDSGCTKLQKSTARESTVDAVQHAQSKSSPKAQPRLNVRSALDHEATAPELRKSTANLPSSPPTSEQQILPSRTNDLIDERSAGKATLISFDRDGPRNQGTLSGKNSKKALNPQRSIPVLPNDSGHASDYPQNVRAQLSSGKHKALSVLPAATSMWDHFMAPPSNVANSTSDALAEFRRGAPGATTSHTTISSMQAAEQATRPDDGDDAFIFIDDVDTTEAIVSDDHKFARKSLAQSKELTVSQNEMPPPGFLTSKVSGPTKELLERAPQHSPKGSSANTPGTFSTEAKIKRPREVTEQQEHNIHKRQRMTNDLSPGTIVRIFEKNTSTSSQGRQVANDKAFTATQPMLHHRREARVHNAVRKPSQTVDVQGSPVPAGIELLPTDGRTVLEVLSQSQQLALTSEVLPGISSPNYIAGRGFVQPLSPHGEILASNMKPMPASSNNESLRMAGTVLSRLDSARSVKPTGHDQDPFNSAYSAYRQEPTEFSKKLLLMTRGEADARLIATSAEVDPDQGPVNPRTENHSLPSSSGSDVSSELHPSALSDIGTWRAALRADQIDLFDELVTISHKLVRHLVSHETARSDAVADYQKRGAHIIRTMEATHAAQYTQHMSHLMNLRKTVGRKLVACREKLHGVRTSLAELKRRRDEQGGQKHDVQGAMRQVMASVC